jgi:hypothetical protein
MRRHRSLEGFLCSLYFSFSRRGFWGIPAALSVALAAIPALALEPTGYLDAASCESIAGWSQDPDEPAKAIAVHLYFGGPAGTPGAPGIATTANLYRGDLCGAIGSCEHGFSILSPLSLHDGQPRPVHAYGIDSQGGPNPELGASPKSLACAPALPFGVRRKVADVHSYAAWGFQSFWDLLPLGGAEADAIPDGPAMPQSPELIRADDGTETVWLVDGGVRRAVSAEAFVNWRFSGAVVQTRPATEVSALVEGSAMRARPVVFIRGPLYVVDDPQPEVPDSTSSGGGGAGGSSTGSGGGGSGGVSEPPPRKNTDSESCAYRAPSCNASRSPSLLLLAGILSISALAARRRSRRSLTGARS